jgi:predicted ATPase
VLSVANAAESPTALLARREMQSWRLLQLEPSSLRRPDEFTAPAKLGSDGSHLAASLDHLARPRKDLKSGEPAGEDQALQVYSQVANRLSDLIDDVYEVWVDRDERRELLTLEIKDREGTSHPARALSDGTLRFLALAILELDPETEGLLCLEEPENGIHPERIPAMLRLLQDIATDVNAPVGTDNPLRQVIINTHSPVVVGQVPEDSLLVAELKETIRYGQRFKRVCFSFLPGTWRAKAEGSVVSRGELLAYLNPGGHGEAGQSGNGQAETGERHRRKRFGVRRVMDRPDLQMLLPLAPGSE